MPVDSFRWLPYRLSAWMRTVWQVQDETSTTPFTPLAKPLSQTRFALLTTGGLYLKGQQQPFDVEREAREPEWGDPSYRIIPKETRSEEVAVAHTHYNPTDAEEDFNILLPIHRFIEMEEAGGIGSLAPSAYSVMGYQGHPVPDYTLWRERYGPEMLGQMKEEGVEAVLLTPA
ncbi:MAG: glycine/sarcosine/betaine reductase selenoprotein B family protein [Chloroflexi bacterium]|nr:glycine/sarcosine/betaine reductase selenoprotein B family protein [Chloroflexota bacterium]MDA1272145.1 glycine/sarcosine/betaine reductase selenoprotein B family protein [Chloroflexota bacterium]